jgi:hypothetical protein
MRWDGDPRDWDEHGNWIGDEPELELKEPREFTKELLSRELPTDWLVEVKSDPINYQVAFTGPINAPFLTIGRIRSSTRNTEVFTYHEYPSLEDGRHERSEPLVTHRFETLPEALSAVEEAISKYENH